VQSPPEVFNFAAYLLALNVDRASKTALIDDQTGLKVESARDTRTCRTGIKVGEPHQMLRHHR
jgi:hypothetical protein